MSLVTRDRATGLRRGPIRFPNGRPPVPSGCRWCGIERRRHAGRWSGAVGWHGWAPPTAAQTLARMKARRAARLKARRLAAIEATLIRTAGLVGPRERRRRRRAVPERSCTTCAHFLPASPPEEPCNPDGCGCIGYPDACDIRAAPAGAALPITHCPRWEPTP